MKYKINLSVAVGLALAGCENETVTIQDAVEQSGCVAAEEATEGENIVNAKSVKCADGCIFLPSVNTEFCEA